MCKSAHLSLIIKCKTCHVKYNLKVAAIFFMLIFYPVCILCFLYEKKDANNGFFFGFFDNSSNKRGGPVSVAICCDHQDYNKFANIFVDLPQISLLRYKFGLCKTYVNFFEHFRWPYFISELMNENILCVHLLLSRKVVYYVYSLFCIQKRYKRSGHTVVSDVNLRCTDCTHQTL